MLTEQLIELEERVHAAIATLRREIADCAHNTEAISPDAAIGRISRVDAIQIQEMAKDAQRRREARLEKLEAAAERLANETYGMCERCHEDIEWDRLDASPEVTRCTGCS
jgi:DnaK suppressor protein